MKGNVLLVVLLVGLLFPVFGQSTSDFEYEVKNNTVTITGYKGSSKNVVIPEKVGGLPVGAIGERAFRDKQLISVVIPNSVTHIGDRAFSTNQLTRLKKKPSFA